MRVRPIKNPDDFNRLLDYVKSKNTKKTLTQYMLLLVGYNFLLRISDLLKLRLKDIYNFERKTVITFLDLKEKKTKKIKELEISEECKIVIYLYLKSLEPAEFYPDRYLFHNGRAGNNAISEKTAWEWIKTWCDDIEIEVNVGTHTLRKSKLYHILKIHKFDNGILKTISKLLNHSSLQQTLDYLDITQDDINRLHTMNTLNRDESKIWGVKRDVYRRR